MTFVKPDQTKRDTIPCLFFDGRRRQVQIKASGVAGKSLRCRGEGAGAPLVTLRCRRGGAGKAPRNGRNSPAHCCRGRGQCPGRAGRGRCPPAGRRSRAGTPPGWSAGRHRSRPGWSQSRCPPAGMRRRGGRIARRAGWCRGELELALQVLDAVAVIGVQRRVGGIAPPDAVMVDAHPPPREVMLCDEGFDRGGHVGSCRVAPGGIEARLAGVAEYVVRLGLTLCTLDEADRERDEEDEDDDNRYFVVVPDVFQPCAEAALAIDKMYVTRLIVRFFRLRAVTRREGWLFFVHRPGGPVPGDVLPSAPEVRALPRGKRGALLPGCYRPGGR